MLNTLQHSTIYRRCCWLAVCCYLLVQGIVPVGYMPGKLGSETPFVLCHGDSLSAQWISEPGHEPRSTLVNVQESLMPEDAQSTQDNQSQSSRIIDLNTNETLHDVDHAKFQCQFSTFYFSKFVGTQSVLPLWLFDSQLLFFSTRVTALKNRNHSAIKVRAPPRYFS